MANLKNAKKAIRVNSRNQQRNQAYKTKLKSNIKLALSAIDTKDKDLETIIRNTCQVIDKTAAKGVIKKKNASRRKSNLMRHYNASK